MSRYNQFREPGDPLPYHFEFLANELKNAYPGLHEHAYEHIAWEATHPSSGRTRGKEWAMTATRLALLEKTRRERKPSADDAWNE